ASSPGSCWPLVAYLWAPAADFGELNRVEAAGLALSAWRRWAAPTSPMCSVSYACLLDLNEPMPLCPCQSPWRSIGFLMPVSFSRLAIHFSMRVRRDFTTSG